MKGSGKNPRLRQAANRYAQAEKRPTQQIDNVK